MRSLWIHPSQMPIGEVKTKMDDTKGQCRDAVLRHSILEVGLHGGDDEARFVITLFLLLLIRQNMKMVTAPIPSSVSALGHDDRTIHSIPFSLAENKNNGGQEEADTAMEVKIGHASRFGVIYTYPASTSSPMVRRMTKLLTLRRWMRIDSAERSKRRGS